MLKSIYLLSISFILFVVLFLYGTNADAATKQRDGKVFSLFSIVSFKNKGCRATTGYNGTCYTSTECASKSGTASGNCAAGFGVCCTFIYTAASTLSENSSYIQNPNYPSAYGATSSLSFTVSKCANDICTVRLDFEAFITAGPTTTDDTTACVDSFKATASPSGFATPSICGLNTGSHIYLDIGPASGAYATLAWTFGTSTTISRYWNVKVQQIECSNPSRPPDSGCLQYHTGVAGRFNSFNYKQTSTSLYGHLPSQNYGICIRQEAGMNCIQYTVCDTLGFSIDNEAATNLHGTKCSLDFIVITGSSQTCNNPVLNSRYCGVYLGLDGSITGTYNTPICDCTGPFVVQLYTNANAADTTTTTLSQRGLCLQYSQINSP